MLGYEYDELLATPVSRVHPDEMPVLMALRDAVFSQGHGWTNELTCTTKNGTVLPSEISASVLEVDGKALMVAMVRDVSERRRAEQTLQQQMRELAVLEERSRLAREIHDTLAQGLIAIIWQLNAAERTLGNEAAEAHAAIEKVRAIARESLKETRRSVWDLRAGPLLGLTLAQAIGREADRTFEGTDTQNVLRVSGEERALPSGVEASALRITLEALANVVKHADADRVEIEIAFGESELRLWVSDDGTGFAPEMLVASSDGGGFGLVNMRERARLLGGEAIVRSEPGTGTTVEITIPLS
jgi:signal transduction histidine kinase